jgi:putative nucleotidyltransferase with HDIG domain
VPTDVAPPERSLSTSSLRRAQWRLLATIAGLLVVYAAISSLSALPGASLPPGTLAHQRFFLAEVAFETLLTAALAYVLFRVIGQYMAAPIHQIDALLRLLAELTDAREHAVYGHCWRVGEYSRVLARALGLSARQAEEIAYAGLLHDIGKIGVPDSILNKPERLTDAERAVMMGHAAAGANIVAQAGPLAKLAPLIRHHHEWWDGRGYPDGLAGDAIPLGARIIAVADALDTMTTDRPYRAARRRRDALAEIRRCAGSQFDPHVVAAIPQALGDPALHDPGAGGLLRAALLPPEGGAVALLTLAEQERAARPGSTPLLQVLRDRGAV